jgi:hypothetical protein
MRRLRQSQLALVLFLAISALFAHESGLTTLGNQQFTPDRFVLWADPGDVNSLDFRHGVGGAENQPEPPFHFIEEDLAGTSPKVFVKDGRGSTWNVKWGSEARPSAFCTRLMWACGYIVQPEYFLKSGQIEGARDLKRAKSHISDDGSFVNARFQLRSDAPEYLEGHEWTWTNNPFLGTAEIEGLKILSLLVSNWDTKDSNLGMFLDNRSGTSLYYYSIMDWGGTLGKWGNLLTWSRGDCQGFAVQTPDFVKRAKDGSLQWGFNGKNREELTSGITGEDIRWLLQYLGQITDEQIRTGLIATGHTAKDVNCYTRALRSRIRQLEQVAN